jgi:hypothetical protein
MTRSDTVRMSGDYQGRLTVTRRGWRSAWQPARRHAKWRARSAPPATWSLARSPIGSSSSRRVTSSTDRAACCSARPVTVARWRPLPPTLTAARHRGARWSRPAHHRPLTADVAGRGRRGHRDRLDPRRQRSCARKVRTRSAPALASDEDQMSAAARSALASLPHPRRRGRLRPPRRDACVGRGPTAGVDREEMPALLCQCSRQSATARHARCSYAAVWPAVALVLSLRCPTARSARAGRR